MYKDLENEFRFRMVTAAIPAYETYRSIPRKKGHRPKSFEAYCSSLGIKPRRQGLTGAVVDSERKRAQALFQKALGMQWSEKPGKK